VTPPDFRELVGEDLSPEEAARLRGVHDLLVAAGPPPELSPALERTPAPPTASITRLVARRWKATALLAAAVAVAAFGLGYLAGSSGNGNGNSNEAFAAQHVVRLHGSGAMRDATVVVRVGKRDSTGNLPMALTAEGLPHRPAGQFYYLYMTKGGKRTVVCASFNVDGGNKETTLRFAVGYPLKPFDGFAVTEWRPHLHQERQLMSAQLA
jgi:hypothetical protein